MKQILFIAFFIIQTYYYELFNFKLTNYHFNILVINPNQIIIYRQMMHAYYFMLMIDIFKTQFIIYDLFTLIHDFKMLNDKIIFDLE
jgi:hypothetical protein